MPVCEPPFLPNRSTCDGERDQDLPSQGDRHDACWTPRVQVATG